MKINIHIHKYFYSEKKLFWLQSLSNILLTYAGPLNRQQCLFHGCPDSKEYLPLKVTKSIPFSSWPVCMSLILAQFSFTWTIASSSAMSSPCLMAISGSLWGVPSYRTPPKSHSHSFQTQISTLTLPFLSQLYRSLYNVTFSGTLYISFIYSLCPQMWMSVQKFCTFC